MAELKIWDGSAWRTIAIGGAVLESLFDANSILKADSDNTPVALFVNPNSLVGRQSGDITEINIETNTLVGRQGFGALGGLNVAANRLVGRMSDAIDDLTATQALDVLAAALCKPHIASLYYSSYMPHAELAFAVDRNDGASGLIQGRYFFAMGDTIDTINLNCSTEDAGSDGLPNTLVYESGNISLTGAGVKQASGVAQHLDPGWYFIAHYSDSASTAVFEVLATQAITVGLSSPTAVVRTITKSATFGTAPDPFGTPTSYSSSNAFCDVFTYV
jgi:hypothetical protein